METYDQTTARQAPAQEASTPEQAAPGTTGATQDGSAASKRAHRADQYHARHPDWVAEFNQLTHGECAGGPSGARFGAVRAWQNQHWKLNNLVADGLVGPKTLEAARKLAAPPDPTAQDVKGGGDQKKQDPKVSDAQDAADKPKEHEGGGLTGWLHDAGQAIERGISALGEAATAVGEVAAALGHPDGISTTAAKSVDGKALPVGTFVRVHGFTHTGELKITAYSGINAEAVIPRASFHPEPGLVMQTDAKGNSNPRDDVFKEYTAPLWDAATGPKAADADVQGALGDCYFMASMGAVCGANPGAIKSLFSPQTPSKAYTVTLYKKTLLGSLTPVTYAVDDWLPTSKDGSGQVYANTSSTPSAKNAGPQGRANTGALWVSFLEKAWAMHKGSYDKAAGGWGVDGMEALTGQKSATTSAGGTDGKGGGVLDQFRQMATDGKAVAIGTKQDAAEASVGYKPNKFAQQGSTFTAQLDPSLVFQTVQIYAPNFTGKDDSNNNILQSSGAAKLKSGTVDYQKGLVTLVFDAAAQPDVAQMQVAWSHCGPDFQKYGLIGTHEYRFTGMREPDAISLMNPWGFQHPKPVDAPGIAKLFSEIASNLPTKPAVAAAGATAGGAKT